MIQCKQCGTPWPEEALAAHEEACVLGRPPYEPEPIRPPARPGR